MTKFIFIRHAESDISIKDEMSRPLTKSGEIISSRIPLLFNDEKIDHIYCSPYKRAIDTIKPLADQKEIKISVSIELRERENGGWVNGIFSYVKKQWDDFDYKLENGESLREVQKRYVNFINTLVQKHKNKCIVIGTHGTALCSLLNNFNPEVNHEYFISMVDKMPFIVSVLFDDCEYHSMETIDIVSLANVS